VQYSQAIRRDPKNKLLYQNRATAYSKLMVFDAALRDCEAALKIDPNFVKAHARAGYCYKGACVRACCVAFRVRICELPGCSCTNMHDRPTARLTDKLR
jgi:stress-induced-phosphoprotein 1